MLAIVLFVSIIFLVFLSKFHFFKNIYKFWKLKIPSVEGWVPIFGHLHLILLKNKFERLKILTKFCHKNQRMAKCWIGLSPTILVSHPDIFQKILLSDKCLEKQEFMYGLLNLNRSILVAKTESWKIQRRYLNYSFGSKMLRNFIPTFEAISDELVDQLSDKVDGETFDLHESIKKFVFKTLLINLFGSESQKKLSDESEELMGHIESILEIFAERLMNPLLYSSMAFSHSSLGIEDREIRKFGLSLIEELYNERFEQLHETESDITEKTLMDIFLNNFEKFSKTEILENLATLLIAGYDTTTTTVSNVILMLAIHPEIQEKLYSHIEENFKDFTEENLNKLDYLNQVMNETMRLFPAAPVIFRSTTDYLELDGQILPKNTNFILNFFALHRNKAVWGEDAEKFDPNRFSRAAVERRHPFAFLAFSGGKRNCVGYRYGCLSMKITLVKFLKRYKATTSLALEDLEAGCDILLNMSPGSLIKITKRSE